ncbi:carboxypeptidase B1-like [Musca vetustissima]|uniref:carboxypeptidase B1-like n=1 Tax=Musca vetustissima TaxID=27455 RepID=UPI002AB799AA|nr:carboxypeptidase B1-like [Musca vetustissima]
MWWKNYYLHLALLVIGATLGESYELYKDYKIYNVYAENENQLHNLYKLSKANRKYDFLNLARRPEDITKILIPPQLNDMLKMALEGLQLNFTLAHDDVSQLILKERQEHLRNTPPEYPLKVFERYYRHDEINTHMEVLAQLYPSRVYVKTFGWSYERRPLKVITITNGDKRNDKKVIFVDAAMHAREWITPAMALHIMSELIENYENNKHLLEEYDWVILPVVNADGYEYTHEEYRYWRKTRKPNYVVNEDGEECFGTDPNRNFGHYWDFEEGASSDPCDELYRGEKAFSEPETQVVRDIMRTYRGRLMWYLTLHSYGNYILLPWGHTNELPENFYEMMDVADAGAMAIVLTTGTSYTYGNTYKVIYPTSGDSSDYALAAINVPVSLCIEMPAGGFSGFDPPPRQIEGFVTETWIGVRAMAETVIEKY